MDVTFSKNLQPSLSSADSTSIDWELPKHWGAGRQGREAHAEGSINFCKDE